MTDQGPNAPQDNEFFQRHLFDVVGEDKVSSAPPAVVDDAARDDLLVSLLALASVKGIGFKTLCAMFDAGFLSSVWDWDLNEIAHQWSLLPSKPRLDLARNVYERRQMLLEAGKRAAEGLHKQQVVFLPLGHSNYPRSLLKLKDPPRWLFARGNLEAVQSECMIAVVGTRKPSSEGKKLAYGCARELVYHNIIVLSGLAKGIDELAHLGAVHHYGQSVAVLGHGINAALASSSQTLWSSIVETDGSVISEYLPQMGPTRENFLRRNELQAAMASVVIPIECPSMTSGTGATIRRATNLGTPVVGVVPHNVREPTLVATRDNLAKLGYPVFTLSGETSDEFWAYLRAKLPNHKWDRDPRPRQDRLFSIVERRLLEAKSRASLDEDAMDRFAERLKKKLRE